MVATTTRSDTYQRWKAAQEQASGGEEKRKEELTRAQSLTDTLRRELGAIPNTLQELQEREALHEQTRRNRMEQVLAQIDGAQVCYCFPSTVALLTL